MLDPNIALQFKGMQLDDPMDQMGRAMSLSNMGMQQQFMQSRMAEQERAGTLSQMRGRAYMQSGGDPAKLRNMLASNEDYEGLIAHDKQQMDAQKAQGDLAAQKAGMGDKLVGLRAKAAQFAYTGGTTQHAIQAAQLLHSSGDTEGAQHIMQAVQEFPDASPEQVRQFFAPHLAFGQTPDDLLKPKLQDIGGELIDLNPNTKNAPIKKTQSPESVASNQVAREGHQVTREGHNVTVRGQNLTNDRSIEKNKIDANVPKLTEIQSKAQLYGKRAQASHDILNSLQGKYSALAVNAKMSANDMPLIGGAGGLIGNSLLSENGQKAEQAQRDFVNAILRQESGAVISEPEFRNAQKQYFPQPGDTKGTLKQKRENRERAIQAIDVMSGPAGGFSKQQSGNNIDSLLDKYK